ncbi:MAG: hypothetical protein OEM01_02300 [Desulfobulbaceae bacterium]|nr:hypothetical protein [Desulfobulbaceae bacterium]
MKISIREMLVLWAIIPSLVTVSPVWAVGGKSCNVTVKGEITAIDYDYNTITVGETTVHGIPFDYLDRENIDLSIDDSVEITAHQCNKTGNLEACTLWVGFNLGWGRATLTN